MKLQVIYIIVVQKHEKIHVLNFSADLQNSADFDLPKGGQSDLGLQIWFTYQNVQNYERRVMEMVASLYSYIKIMINWLEINLKGAYKG